MKIAIRQTADFISGIYRNLTVQTRPCQPRFIKYKKRKKNTHYSLQDRPSTQRMTMGEEIFTGVSGMPSSFLHKVFEKFFGDEQDMGWTGAGMN